MTDDQQTAQGIDLETLEEFAEHAAEDPEAVQLGLGASATYEGTAAHSLAKVDSYELGGETIARETREYTIPYGAWKEVLDAGGWVGGIDRLAASKPEGCSGTANAITTEMETARPDRIVLTDDDVHHIPDWLATLTADLERHGPCPRCHTSLGETSWRYC